MRIFRKTLVQERRHHTESESLEPDWYYVENVDEVTEQLGELLVNGVRVGKGVLSSVEDVFQIQRVPNEEVQECSWEEYSAAEGYYSVEQYYTDRDDD